MKNGLRLDWNNETREKKRLKLFWKLKTRPELRSALECKELIGILISDSIIGDAANVGGYSVAGEAIAGSIESCDGDPR